MRYDVTFSCGHTGSVVLHGSGDARAEGRLRWFEEHALCPDCKAEAEKKERDAKDRRAAETTKGFPALVGTPKQIAWATTLRAKFFDALYLESKNEESRILATMCGGDADMALAKQKENAAKIEAYFKEKTDCRFWIDGRDVDFGMRVAEAKQNCRQ